MEVAVLKVALDYGPNVVMIVGLAILFVRCGVLKEQLTELKKEMVSKFNKLDKKFESYNGIKQEVAAIKALCEERHGHL